MINTIIGVRDASHKSTLLLALLIAAALGSASASAMAETAGGTRSQITDVRIGVANHYKFGHWTPVVIEADPVTPDEDHRVEVIVPDSDGVPTVASAPLHPSTMANAAPSAVVYTKVGRSGVPIRIVLRNRDRVVDERTLRPGAQSNSRTPLFELPATGELIVALSSTPFGLEQAVPTRDAGDSEFPRRTIRTGRVADLPVDWFGYEAVDLLVICAGDGELCRELAADEARHAALVRWIELGGRLVVLCGGEPANELLAEGGALAALVPGKFQDVVRLAETGPLEHFAAPAASIGRAGGGVALAVPRLAEIDGKIEVFAGRQPGDLPLVIRGARGLGEVAFAAVDPAAPPLAEWTGRTTFLQALVRPYVASDANQDGAQTLVTLGYNDLSGALRQRLGRQFASVVPFGFATVALLAIAYLVVLGPLDYLLVHRWLRRPLAAWITFPTIVLLFGIVGLTLAERRRGTGGARVNQLQLVDVDAPTGQSRATYWSALYTPDAKRFHLAVEAVPIAAHLTSRGETLVSWWGLPGVGIGGMQAGGTNLGIVRDAYYYSEDRDALAGVPVLASATKSLVARWTGTGNTMIEADLSDEDGFASGSLVNRSGWTLRDVRLLYGTWGYRLGDLPAGQRIEVGEQRDPLSVKTIVTRSALGGAAVERETVFVPERASALELVNLMMFYEAAGGIGFAQLPHRYQAYCDLSRHLALGRAIVVAEADGAGRRLVEGLMLVPIGDEGDERAVVVRVVLPVEKNSGER